MKKNRYIVIGHNYGDWYSDLKYYTRFYLLAQIYARKMCKNYDEVEIRREHAKNHI